jgi:alcohol dehydrogenase (NADP+)
MPAIGFGTWQDADAQEPAVTIALKLGYRHIDTARIYGTEAAVGKALKNFGIPRDQIFITTKLWSNSHHPDYVPKALDASLKDLGVDYLDLYLIHWPSPFARSDTMMPKDEDGKIQKGDTDYVDTYKAIEEYLKSEKTKAIGISNFSKAKLEGLLKETFVVGKFRGETLTMHYTVPLGADQQRKLWLPTSLRLRTGFFLTFKNNV